MGLARTSKHLQRAQKILQDLQRDIDQFYHETALNRDLIELRHGIMTANCIVEACIDNKKSLGCHFIKE